MQKKLIIDGENADKHSPLRTTDSIYDALLIESGERQLSVNVIINKILSPWARAKRKKKLLKSTK